MERIIKRNREKVCFLDNIVNKDIIGIWDDGRCDKNFISAIGDCEFELITGKFQTQYWGENFRSSSKKQVIEKALTKFPDLLVFRFENKNELLDWLKKK